MKLRLVETQFIKEEDSQNKAFQDIVYDVFDGSDFMIGNVDINEDGVDFDVTAMGPEGSMERHVHLAIPSYEEQLRWACEDWMSDHSTPDSFYESNKEEYPKDDYMIDPETASIDEIQAWLDKNNDKSEHSDDFNKLWLDIYKYLQRKKEKEGIKDSEESEATQTEDIAKKEEYKNMVTPTFKVGKKISLED